MRYRCLVLDHDDTVMDSTRSIHHPAFLDALEELRPGITISLEDYFRVNFDPGFLEYCERTLRFTPEELTREYEIWQSWVKRIVPEPFDGIAHLIRRHAAEGGLICVVSHSVADNILRDYEANGLPRPALVFGWEQPRDRRKPNPWPLEEIARRLSLSPREMLMVDDLKPGLVMADAAGVDFAAALWAHRIPEIHARMRKACRFAFDTPQQLESWLFG